MERRVPASERTREALRDLIEGRVGSADAGTELIQLATRLIFEESLEVEHRDVLGRDYYERGAETGQGYRNGYRTGKLKATEGLIEYAVPQIAMKRSLCTPLSSIWKQRNFGLGLMATWAASAI